MTKRWARRGGPLLLVLLLVLVLAAGGWAALAPLTTESRDALWELVPMSESSRPKRTFGIY